MTTELVTTDNLRNLPEVQREHQVTLYLEAARDRLAVAVEMTGPETVAAIKAEIATAAEATRQLGLSKEIQMDAEEMVRRAEYALGKAIRKGQESGTVQPRHLNRGDVNNVGHRPPSPHEVAGESSRKHMTRIYSLSDGVTEEQLDEALTEARAEDNVSRANVARKIKGQQSGITGQNRLDKIESMAQEGHTSQQIAAAIGHNAAYIRQLARGADIDIRADRVVGRRRRIDANQVVENTAQALEGLVLALDSTDLAEVNRETAQTWIDSLNQSLSALSKARNKIKESLS